MAMGDQHAIFGEVFLKSIDLPNGFQDTSIIMTKIVFFFLVPSFGASSLFGQLVRQVQVANQGHGR